VNASRETRLIAPVIRGLFQSFRAIKKYAQYVCLKAENLLRSPAHLAAEEIASLELAMCVQATFNQIGKLDGVRGQRLGISGLGPAGLIAVQMARSYGAHARDGRDVRRIT
jgi:D-arabinose 1-dehydrogenase-like Zn-dependent alcohol dehydrogenase